MSYESPMPTVRQKAEELLGHALPAELVGDEAVKVEAARLILDDRGDHGAAYWAAAFDALAAGDSRAAIVRYQQRRELLHRPSPSTRRH